MRLQPGTDIALINGMMNVIISEGIYNQKFVSQRTLGFDEAQGNGGQIHARVCGEDHRMPSRRRSGMWPGPTQEQRKSTILYTMGITQHTVGTNNVLSIANLAMLCGMIGRASTGVNPLRGQNNVQGACDMGALPNVLTAYQSVGAIPHAGRSSSQSWNCQISDKPGLTVGEMMTAADIRPDQRDVYPGREPGDQRSGCQPRCT